MIAETAEELLIKRFNALKGGDFATVYATYHKDSPFIKQFSDRATYIRFAEQNLSCIEVINWQMFAARVVESGRQEQLLAMELTVDGANQFFYELAMLIETPDGWRYHSAQKLSAEDFSGPPELIRFAHFDQAADKIRY